MAKVAGKHGEKSPELLEIKRLFEALADDLLRHAKEGNGSVPLHRTG